MKSNFVFLILSTALILSCGNKQNDTVFTDKTIPNTAINAETEIPALGDSFVRIKSGSFIMGNDEFGPAHKVTITYDYLMSSFELTNRDVARAVNWAVEAGFLVYDKDTFFMPAGNQLVFVFNTLLPWQPFAVTLENGKPSLEVTEGNEALPFVNINMQGAAILCNIMSVKDGFEQAYDLSSFSVNWKASGYRMPTEAEWEFAARRLPADNDETVSSTLFSGSDDASRVAWTYENTPGSPRPVAAGGPNAIGLYDMSGNVWEMCWDLYSDAYYEESPEINPKGPQKSPYPVWTIVKRGGSYRNYENNATVFHREMAKPDANPGVGIRLVRKAD